MKCTRCGNEMTNAVTTFTVVKTPGVYAVENVPCSECLVCGDISFSQDVAKELGRYCSGRAIPTRTAKTWVFNWGDPIVEIPKTSITSTANTPISVSIPGTSGTAR